ncbi:MAG: ATP synthase F0 subunit B [Candidatus Angelobacter sp.]
MGRHIRRKLLAGLFALLCAALFATPSARAQDAAARHAAAPSAQSSGSAPAQTAEAKNEKDAGGSDADSVRNSPAVKWIARKTGLTVDQAYWLCFGFNFAVVLVLIVGLLRKKLPGYFSGRTTLIQKGIEEARKMSEEARRRLAEVESRLSRLDADIAAMRGEAEENAKAEERRILAAGEEERQRIVTSAGQEISLAASAARRELKSYAAELAIDLAEKKIRVSKETDEALVHKFTVELGKDDK